MIWPRIAKHGRWRLLSRGKRTRQGDRVYLGRIDSLEYEKHLCSPEVQAILTKLKGNWVAGHRRPGA